jgi:hypothetical protein
MPALKEKLPPPKDGPPITEPKNRKPSENEIDIDDAMIKEPPEEDVEDNDPPKAQLGRSHIARTGGTAREMWKLMQGEIREQAQGAV